MNEYKGQKALLASMHKKEIAIAPPFNEIVHCEIITTDNFNTDEFGTFSGEISRKLSAYETLKLKATTASNIYDFDYVISSEGSFGPHPSNPFIRSDIEMLLFYDRSRELFISEYEISSDTNHGELAISKNSINSDSFFKWLEQVRFPSHGLVLKSGDIIIQKGIFSFDELNDLLEDGFNKYSELKLETDMRAMINPTRMNVIAKLAQKLATKVATNCIKCGTPGFGNEEKSGHLCCEICHNQIRIPKYIDKKCLKCDYVERQEIDSSKQYTDPQYCDYCNP